MFDELVFDTRRGRQGSPPPVVSVCHASKDLAMHYPTPAEVQHRLKRLATEAGDTTAVPCRVDMVRVYGGKPPVYTVVMLSRDKAPLQRKLAQILNRSLSLGVSCFALQASEAKTLLQH